MIQRCNIATALCGIRLTMNCNVMKTHISNNIRDTFAVSKLKHIEYGNL